MTKATKLLTRNTTYFTEEIKGNGTSYNVCKHYYCLVGDIVSIISSFFWKYCILFWSINMSEHIVNQNQQRHQKSFLFVLGKPQQEVFQQTQYISLQKIYNERRYDKHKNLCNIYFVQLLIQSSSIIFLMGIYNYITNHKYQNSIIQQHGFLCVLGQNKMNYLQQTQHISLRKKSSYDEHGNISETYYLTIGSF